MRFDETAVGLMEAYVKARTELLAGEYDAEGVREVAAPKYYEARDDAAVAVAEWLMENSVVVEVENVYECGRKSWDTALNCDVAVMTADEATELLGVDDAIHSPFVLVLGGDGGGAMAIEGTLTELSEVAVRIAETVAATRARCGR